MTDDTDVTRLAADITRTLDCEWDAARAAGEGSSFFEQVVREITDALTAGGLPRGEAIALLGRYLGTAADPDDAALGLCVLSRVATHEGRRSELAAEIEALLNA